MPSSQDIELKLYPFKEDSLARYGSSFAMREPVYEDPEPQGWLGRWVDSFRRDPSTSTIHKDPMDDILAAEVSSVHDQSLLGPHYYDMRMAVLRTAQSNLARRLKGRHLQMIAIGGSIGRWIARPQSHTNIILTARPARNWPVCGVGESPRDGWPSLCPHCLLVCRRHALLYRAGPRGARRCLSCSRLLLGFLDTVP
jgi:hypothetical protein